MTFSATFCRKKLTVCCRSYGMLSVAWGIASGLVLVPMSFSFLLRLMFLSSIVLPRYRAAHEKQILLASLLSCNTLRKRIKTIHHEK